MSECSSTHLFLDRKTHETVKLQCRLQAGHNTVHEAYYGENIVLWFP